jgi:hypothetical protein
LPAVPVEDVIDDAGFGTPARIPLFVVVVVVVGRGGGPILEFTKFG